MRPLAVQHRIAELGPDTDPASVSPVLAEQRPRVLQFSEPLPDALLEAAAAALMRIPEVGFRVYGREVDPSLGWLERFVRVRDLSIDLWHATSFDLLASFENLQRLSLGETKSRRPSLAFLPELPSLEVLWIEAHDRDFAAIGEVPTLKQLNLRVPRAKSLEPITGHRRLEAVSIDFGGIRDLRPLAEIPGLRALQIYQTRNLDTDDFAAIGRCETLVALSLGALRHVTRLEALTRGPSSTLRYLTIERMMGLETLADLGKCRALEQLHMTEAKPKDGRLDLVARAPALRYLIVGDHYSKEQVTAAEQVFSGETLRVRGTTLRGDPGSAEIPVSWRRPVADYLAL